MNKKHFGIAVGVVAVSLSAGCGGSGTASNTVGQGAASVLHVVLRPAVSTDSATALTQQINNIPGVAYSEFTPGQGITIGVRTTSDVAAVEAAVLKQSAVSSVSPIAAPSVNGPSKPSS